jgi:hypothetical protein
MEHVAKVGSWGELYVMLGTSSAALIGLLFVATSLHLKAMADHPVLRTRSRNLTLHLTVMLVQATAVLMPQPLQFLGIEVIVVNLCGLSLPLTFLYRTMFSRTRKRTKGSGFSLYMGLAYILAYTIGIAGGVALSQSLLWGLYLVTFSNAIFFVLVILNGWKLMFGIQESE